MEQQNDLTFEFNVTMDRFYKFFSDLIEKDLDEKNDARYMNSNKKVSSK